MYIVHCKLYIRLRCDLVKNTVKFKTYDIEKIVEMGNQEDMEHLSYMLEETICDLKELYPNKYKEYKNKLYGMAYGYAICDELREEIVNKIGEHWTLDETEKVRHQYRYENISPNEFNVVMNMAYSDYSDIFDDDLDLYAKFSRAFIEDKDAKKGKVYLYFSTIPKGD